MEISIHKQSNNNVNNNNTALLPSLFGNHVVAKEGLMAINDSSLTQQIEFILQDATINENELEHIDNNPPNSTCASEQQIQQLRTGQQSNNNNNITNNNNNHNRNNNNIITSNTLSAEEAQLLNNRGIIIQSRRPPQQQVEQSSSIVVEEDPELNDENLQDIEAETQESEAELQHVDEQYSTVAQIKLEQYENGDLDQFTPTQLVLPNGTIVRTTSTSNGLHTLSTLNRRPVYISEVPNVTNIENLPNSTTMINMPSNAVIRSVVNLVNTDGNSIQLQPNSTPTSIGTSVVVTSASHTLPAGVSIVPLSNVGNITSLTSAQIINRMSQNNEAATETSSKKTVVKKANKKSNPNVKIVATSSATANSSECSAKSTGALLCSDCPERFDNKELFDVHRSGHLNNMKCSICNMVLKSLKNYEKHCMRCKPYECQICGRIVRFRPNFIKHMRVHTACQAAERHKYKCEFCHKEFMSFEYFKVHKKIHSENVNLTCEICGKVFSALASLRGHSKLHSGHKLHKCDVCGKGFGQRYNLKIHARTHTGEFPYECSLCKKKLHTEKALETHLKIHQRADENSSTTRNRTMKKTKSVANRVNTDNNGRFEKPSTSGLQQLCAIASDNLKNFNNQIDSTTINDTTDGLANLKSNECEDEINNMNKDKQITSIRAPAHTVVINNVVQNKIKNKSNVNSSVSTSKAIGVITQSTKQQQQKHTQVIQTCGNIQNNSNHNSVLKQQLMRQTPIIQTTASTYIVQNKKTLSTPVTTPTIIMSRSSGIGTPTICTVGQPNQFSHTLSHTISSNNQRQMHQQSPDRDISLDVDDEAHVMDAHDMVHDTADGNSCNSVLANDNATIMPMTHQVSTIHSARQCSGEHFDDDTNDDDKSSPSLATTAIIKQEPNFYSSGSADNSNDFIKEEVIFDDSQNAHSPRTHSSLSSKFCMSNFDTDHHGPMDLNHTLPPYGQLFESHSIPDSIPFVRMDDDDFQLDHSSLGGLHNASNSTTDGEFLKKEWVYGTSNNFHMSGKFDEDTDPMCEPASFVYN